MGTVAKLKYGDTTHLIASTCYGTCPTAEGTVAKVATIQDSQAFSLINGITIHIKFTYSNTATNPTLNVNSTGAKAIKMYGTTATGKTATASWYAGSVVSFTYDGTNWIQNDYKADTNTTYSAGTGLSLSSTTFNHSNSVTAQTTQKVYPIKIDAQGHISAYGTSPTTLSGYGITDAVLKSGDTMTGALTIKVTSAYDDNSPSRLILQTVDSTNNVTSTGYIMAYNGGANGANLVIQPGGNMFLGSGEAALNHYNSAYTHSTGETMYITSDGGIHIQANGQTIANRVGAQIDTSGNLVPEKADVATNNIGGIGTSTYKWANGYFYNINGVAVGDSPEFTDTWRPINYVGKSAQGGLGRFPITFLAGDNIDISLSSSSSMETLTIDATNTTYANGTGITIGTGNKINHSNSVTAQTTQAVYPIKIDAQGHISAYGSKATPNDLLAFDAGTAGIALASGDNVDTLDVGKTYYSASSTVSAALAGTPPTTSSGFKIVTCKNYSGNNYLFQFAIKYMGRDKTTSPFTDMGNIFVRHKYRDASDYPWSAWYKFYTSENLLSETAASGGSTLSLVTTGEKYTWNGKQNALTRPVTGSAVWSAADRIVVTNANSGNVVKQSAYTIAKSVPSTAEFTDAKVAQTATTTNATYEILFSETASNDDLTEGAGKTSTLTFNPSTNLLSTTTVRASNALEVNNTTTNGSQVKFRFSDLSSSQYALMYAARDANYGGRLRFRQYSENSSGTLLSKYETYQFPKTTQGLSANKDYTIVTTKDGLDVLTGYGTCSTAAATAAKTASVTGLTALTTGATIHIKFTYGNTKASPTLNVNSLGAKAIVKWGTTAAGADVNTSWSDGAVVTFTYDGTSWVMNDHIDNTNTWRTVQVNGTSIGSNTLNLKSGNNITVSRSSGTATFSIPSTTAPTYTVTSSSSSNKWSDANIVATRWGNVVQIVLRLSGTGSSVTAGTDGYTGTVSGTYMPSRQVTLMGYTGKTLLMGWLETNGTLTVRANEATQVASGNGLWLTGTFVTDTDTTG